MLCEGYFPPFLLPWRYSVILVMSSFLLFLFVFFGSSVANLSFFLVDMKYWILGTTHYIFLTGVLSRLAGRLKSGSFQLNDIFWIPLFLLHKPHQLFAVLL